MRKILISLLSLLLLCGAFLLFVNQQSKSRLGERYKLAAQKLRPTTAKSAVLQIRGKHLVQVVLGCAKCHGQDMGGKVFLKSLPVMQLAGPNLTSGKGSVVKEYKETDWVRALRHGIGQSSKGLLGMPLYSALSDEDLRAVILYLKSLPPVDRQESTLKLGLLGRILVTFGTIAPKMLKANHTAIARQAPVSIKPATNVRYGRYLAEIGGCLDCHGQERQGKTVAPGLPPATDITALRLANWTHKDFVKSMTKGKRPNGTTLHPLMPWKLYKFMTALELKALWLFLKSPQKK